MKSRRNRGNIRSLRARAGRAQIDRHTPFEPLEERKLLFSITITPSMDFDGDGIGNATATFGYVIPYFDNITEIEDAETEDVTEDFNDQGVGPIPNNFLLADSDIRVTHNFTFGQNFRLAPADPDIDDKYIQANNQNGSVFMFEPVVPPEDPNDPFAQTFNRSATRVSFTIDDPDTFGLLPNDFVVELVFFDEVIDTFSGDELIAANTTGDTVQRQRGIGTFVFDTSDATMEAFTGVRIRSSTTEDFQLDDLAFTVPSGQYASLVEEHVFGAEISFTAPVGATVQILDLYGRDMQRTVSLGKPDGLELTLVDLDDDGVPNFNEGIGKVIFSGVDSRTNFTMFGGTIEYADNGFEYTRVDNFVGLYDDFEAAGFGYHVEYDDSGQPTVFGLPGGPGSLIFGSPYVRGNDDAGDYRPTGRPNDMGTVADTGFSRPDQGIFVPDGQSIGSIYIHGIMHGSSQFSGAVEDMYFGTLLGSVTVEGALGNIYVGSDAGFWISDDGAQNVQRVDVGSQLAVARSIGEVAIGGRSDLNVTVAGDLSDAQTRAPNDPFRYVEREGVYGFDDSDNPEATIISEIFQPIEDVFGDFFLFTTPGGRSPIFGNSVLRNDTIMGAEFVSSVATSVQISGTIGYGDPINAEDAVDVFAFVVDGTNDVSVQFNTTSIVNLAQIVDVNGRPIAATRRDAGTFNSQEITFSPPSAGVYFLVVTDIGVDFVDGQNGTGYDYIVTLSGLAPVTLGSYRTAGASGRVLSNSVSVLSGDMGVVRVGTAFVDAGGQDTEPTEGLNDAGDLEANMDLLGGSFSTPGNLWAMVIGSDMTGSDTQTNDIVIGGDLGQLVVGLSPVVGGAAGDGVHGDVGNTYLSVGGRVATIDVKGAIGIDQDAEDDPLYFVGLDLRTGTAGGDGSIGVIRVGSDVGTGTLLVTTSPGSVVGGFFVSQDRGEEGNGYFDGINGGGDLGLNDWNLGFGSDLRFVDFPSIDILNSVDHSIEIFAGEILEFVDDGGGIVRIQITGPLDDGTQIGEVRFLPLDNSQGVAIAQLDNIDLSGGRTLSITGTGRLGGGNAPISIGKINIIGADALSGVQITGNVEVDVWSITQTEGDAFDNIRNLTPNGDIVALDVTGVDQIEIGTGSLGRTQVPAFGPQQIGPYLGVEVGEQTGGGEALGVEAAALTVQNLAGAFRPVGTDDGIYLDDIGGPFDGYLNGAVIRSGNVSLVSVGGAVGDVILQGGGEIVEVEANADQVQSRGDFDGIVGTIYAGIINSVDVGAGLAESPRVPMPLTGIFATDELRLVIVDGINNPGAFLGSVVMATNLTENPRPNGEPEVGGIGQIQLINADVRHAYIGGMNLDDFVSSYQVGEGGIFQGTIGAITGTGSSIFASEIEANFLNNLSLTDGAWDGSTLNIGRDALQVDVLAIRNSTLVGTEQEFHLNSMIVGRNLRTLAAESVSDLELRVIGSVLGSISADSLARTVVGVSNTIPAITVADNVSASELNAGRITAFTVGGALRTSKVGVSGPLATLSVGTEIYNTDISVTGPQGQIGAIDADTLISGSISASGPVGSISTASGDIDIRLVTTTDRGFVDSLSAGRDLILDSDISESVTLIEAGRHIGAPDAEGVIFINGSLPEAVAGGHLFSDIRVGQTLDSVTLGGVVNRGKTRMALSGSLIAAEGIGLVTIGGDYGGEILAFSGGVASVELNNGSLLPTSRIAAYDSNVESVVINGGNLYGDIFSTHDVTSVVVNPSADGVFGDLGVNPAFSAGTNYDANRSELPPGVLVTSDKDGPTIVANNDVVSVVVAGGSVFESTIFAGRNLVSLDVAGNAVSDSVALNAGQNVFAAAETINAINVSGNVDNALILAGIRSLGDDLDAGGFGDDADTTQAGSIDGMTFGGNFTNSMIAAGMNPGADKLFNTPDDTLEIGRSTVGPITIAGNATGSKVYTDVFVPGTTAGGKLSGGGRFRPVNHPDIADGVAGTAIPKGANFLFSTSAGSGAIVFNGPGRAFFDDATNRVILDGTNLSSDLVVTTSGARTLDGFDIVSTEGASVGRIRVQAVEITGDSDFVIDESVGRFELGSYTGTGAIQAGSSFDSFVIADFLAGTLVTDQAGSVLVRGAFGDRDPDIRGEAMMSFVDLNNATFENAMRGALSVRRDIGSVTMQTALDNGLIHAGRTIASIDAQSVTESRISAGDALDALDVDGDFFDTSVMVGGDLGDDAEIGGNRFNADQVSAGIIGDVTIGGDFIISDIVAGFLRGPDGFFGTNDDTLSSGRSSIGSVTIGGDALGSNRGGESYRIAAAGPLGDVTVGGGAAQNDRNFVIESTPVQPLPLQVLNIDSAQSGRVFAGKISFNQDVNFASLTDALTVYEVRGEGDVEVRLIPGVDYNLRVGPTANIIFIDVDQSITDRDLPIVTDEPGPGIYRFTIDYSRVKAAGALAQLDGDTDGRVSDRENYSRDIIIGDAGDKLNPFIVDFPGGGGFPAARIDMRGPLNLDVLLDDNLDMDGLPDANAEYLIRGAIGDHPDNSATYFSFASDLDVYAITLQAGQILRLGRMEGAAFLASRVLVQPDGEFFALGAGEYGIELPYDPGDLDNQFRNPTENFYISQTGVYHLLVGNQFAFDDNSIPNIQPAPGGVGDYRFNIEIFDDGDSGFNASTTSGDGQDLVTAPKPAAFAGNDGQLGTADDLNSVAKGGYTFIYSVGDDGLYGTADDLVSGTNGSNVSSATNGLGASIISVDAAIGTPGTNGLPTTLEPDLDVFHLNGGNPVQTGSVIRATLKLTELGSNLGSWFDGGDDVFVSLANYVQFAVFDTTNAKAADDALLVFAPSDISPLGGGNPGTIAESDNVTYGYDDNGDFFIEFVAPGRMDVPGANASYAIYVQGVTNTDYRLEVVSGESRDLVKRKQNVLLEAAGGSVDWVEVGGVTTPIGPFVASALGFTGNAPNGQPVSDYILDRATDIMQDTFDNVVVGAGADGQFGTADDVRGLDITVSNNANDFEFQDFSTVFITSSLDPVSPIFSQTGFFTRLDSSPEFSTQPFGLSEHVDAGNADRNDEAVLFIPSFTVLGYTPTVEDLENLSQSIAAGAARRVGELLGLRVTANYDPTEDVFDVMAANSVIDVPGDTGDYELVNQARRLSDDTDTVVTSDFFIGYQNSAALLSLFTRN